MDTISLRGLTAWGHHGVLDHERAAGQPFVVDLELSVDIAAAAASDDLADTVDYGAVAAAVVAVVAGTPRDLIETVVEEVARTCVAFDGVHAVTATIHKPMAPVGVPFDDVAVTVTRSA